MCNEPPIRAPQIAVAAAQEQQAAVIEQEQEAQASRLAALARRAAAVCAAAASGDGSAPATTAEYEAAFEAILDYVMEAAGLAGGEGAAHPHKQQRQQHQHQLGQSGRARARRAEASAALGSAFPLSAVARWVTLPPGERLPQLLPLAQLTLGICLYNGVGPPAAAAGAAGALAGARGTAGSRPSSRASRGGGSGDVSGTHAAVGALAVADAVQLQQAARLVDAVVSAEQAASLALADACRRDAREEGAAQTGTGGAAGASLFYLQAATTLRQMGADARQGLAACRALGAALDDELAAVSCPGCLWQHGC